MRCNFADGIASQDNISSSATLQNDISTQNDVSLPHISNRRIVNSIASQTNSSIKISNSIPTQTDDFTKIKKHVLCNVNKSTPNLPIINVTICNQIYNFLVDTGSSLSILGQNTFNKLKDKIKYKNLSSNVTISTVNSDVNFSSCIKMSLKLEKKILFSFFLYC